MGIVFYYSPMTSATRVHWALEELGIPYEKVKVDLQKGEQRTPEFLKLNPNGKVPLLVVDGHPVFESLAQLLYLGETFGVDKGLYPAAGTTARLEVYQWMSWASVTVVEAGNRLMRNISDRFPAEQRNAAVAEAARADIAGLMRVLATGLGDRPYLVGDSFTFADIAVGAIVYYIAMRLGTDLSAHPSIGAWLARFQQRPALARALAG